MNSSIKWGQDWVLVEYTGDILPKDILDVWKKLLADKKYDTLKCITHDLSNISSLNATDLDFKVMYHFIKTCFTWNRNIYLSIIFKENEIPKTALRKRKLLKAIGWKINFFTSLEESKAWCNQE